MTALKFRKKPITIEAARVTDALAAAKANWKALPPWLAAAYESGDVLFLPNTIEIVTLEGRMTASPADWIIRGVEGELYPCKAHIFEATYELVSTGEQDTQARRALEVELGDNDSDTPTVRTYLIELLKGVWRDGEGFDGKRPFGNSGWQRDLYKPLIAAGLVEGTLDEDGYVEDVDYGIADDLIARAIAELGRA